MKRSGDNDMSRDDEKRKKRETLPHPGGEREVWGKPEEDEPIQEEPIVKEKANFGLTGMLGKDTNTGNTVNGVMMKWSEPLDAAKPDKQWRLYVFKEDAHIETLHLHRQSSYLIGRDNRVADIVVAHPSCSKQHAVIQYRKVKRRDRDGEPIEKVLPYLLDLQSAQKTFVNGEEIEDSRYFELREKDLIKFGASSREYVVMCGEASTSALSNKK